VFERFEQEVDAIAEWLREGELSRACSVARTNDLRRRYRGALDARAASYSSGRPLGRTRTRS
jgi:hypothetical protein